MIIERNIVVQPTILPVEVSIVWHGRNHFVSDGKAIIVRKIILAFKSSMSKEDKLKFFEETSLNNGSYKLFKENYVIDLPEKIEPNAKRRLYMSHCHENRDVEFNHLQLTVNELSQLFIYVNVEQPETPLILEKISEKNDILKIRHDNKMIKMNCLSQDIEGGHHYRIILKGDNEEFSSLQAHRLKVGLTSLTFLKYHWMTDFIYAVTGKDTCDSILQDKIMQISHLPIKENMEKNTQEDLSHLEKLIGNKNMSTKEIEELNKFIDKIIPLESFRSILISIVKNLNESTYVDYEKIEEIMKRKGR